MKIKSTLIILSLLIVSGCQNNTPPQDTSSTTSATNDATIDVTETEYEFHYDNIGKEFSDLGLTIKLPPNSDFNFFTNQEEIFKGVVAFDTEDANDVNAVAYGDGFMFITSAVVWDNKGGETLEKFVEKISTYENVLEEKDLQIDNYNAKKLVVTSFGNREITAYYTLVDGRFYAFSSPESNLDILEEIIDSVDFDIEKSTEPEVESTPEPIVSEQKSVYDYFVEIPDQYFLDLSVEDRTGNITTLDEENYFIAFAPFMLDGNGSFTIFLSGGEQLFAIETKGCGPLCQQSVYFLKKSGDKYIDVTDQYMPTIDYEKLKEESENEPFNPIFYLPRFGTEIEVRDQMSDKLLHKLKWSGGTFILE